MSARALIIDDEESIRYTFDNFLSEEGYVVATAGNYEDALAKIHENNYDLIFIDIILGQKTGIDLLKEVKSINQNCPVIMITGFPNVETASEAVRLGAFDYIYKPIRQETLIHTAKLALQYKRIQDDNDRYRLNLEAIFRSVKDAIITVDKDLTVLEVNEAAGVICGITRDCVSKPFRSCRTLCNTKCMDIIKKTIEIKNPLELHRTECNIDDRHGKIVTINTSPLLNRQGKFSGVVVVVRDETRINYLEQNLRERQQYLNIIGQSRSMQKIYTLIEDLADVETTVLITGESGTGKELIAEAIHFSGNRSEEPLIKVNCSALPENLLESELFGHVKGAFTGADRDRTGRFQIADGGTLFLDEIGDISLRMQLRLLRILQEKKFERVGDSKPIQVNVRVIAATNQNLAEKVRRSEFREDLYYRLKVVELLIPPLRDRKEDVPLILDYLVQKFNQKFNKNISGVSDDVQQAFMNYNWPGNIRELEHILEHSFVTTHKNLITLDQLPESFTDSYAGNINYTAVEGKIDSETLISALRRAGWNKSKAARLLGINVRTVYRKIEKFNIKEDNDL